MPSDDDEGPEGVLLRTLLDSLSRTISPPSFVESVTSPATVPAPAGVPPGVVGPLLAILQSSVAPIRRRRLLEELERRGHRLSLAGLNRALQFLTESGVTTENPDGVRLKAHGG